MRVDGTRVADPLGGKGPYLKLGLGTLTPSKEVKVQYRVYIGPNALMVTVLTVFGQKMVWESNQTKHLQK